MPGPPLAATGHGPSPVLLGAFLVGGLVALWTGMHWALDIRGTLRLLGAVMALAGVLLVLVTYVLWQLG
ncbi:hypothetical protein V2W30_09340 [Streptomyces sp. Q6]|uniref:Uncharacterized protein n=1 Tax=Streptomyces citrinus TaxID=3118173 RepID=A0ACD5A8I4_9ACTN